VKNWSFAFSQRWFGYLALVVAFATGCVFLSQWQFDRRAEAAAEVARVSTNWDAEPQQLNIVMPELGELDVDNKWIPVSLSGQYRVSEQLLVRGRPYAGQPGFDVLVPFELDGGRVIIIDRGWVPTGNRQDAPDAVPTPPTGLIDIVAHLKPGEPTVRGRSAPEGQVATIHLPTIATMIDDPTYIGGYGLLAEERPSAADMPRAYPKPLLDEGAHLSYAFQWVAFGILAFIGLGWAIRQEYRLINEADPEERERAQKRKRKVEDRGPTDAQIEDAILDA
jgi:cytochrome oxidase assembly protein ShyY1